MNATSSIFSRVLPVPVAALRLLSPINASVILLLEHYPTLI